MIKVYTLVTIQRILDNISFPGDSEDLVKVKDLITSLEISNDDCWANYPAGLDVVAELERILCEEISKTQEQHDIEFDLKYGKKIEDFMRITNNNLDFLYEFLNSPAQDIRTGAGRYIQRKYNDDFYLRREQLKVEEIERFSSKKYN
jgi:hypothetical protein